MRYIQGISALSNYEPNDALILGTALHTGIEKGVKAGLNEYAFSFPIIGDEHINEMIKLEKVIPLAIKSIPKGEFEVMISTKDFIGFIDLLVPNDDGTFDIYDFKYTKNAYRYRDSKQLHLYKYFWEKQTGGKIKNLFFVIVPKIQIRQKKTEELFQFRKRLEDELVKLKVDIVPVQFNIEMVIDYLLSIKQICETKDFEPKDSGFCRFCEYRDYCKEGNDLMIKLPANKRRNVEATPKRAIWIYGAPFSGKTTFANEFPDPLMLNTDGNIKFVDAPYIHIKDQVEVVGRQTKRTLAWEVFKDVVSELEKKENDFKTIVVDLVEDLYEHCRQYMYKEMDIKHESDDSFRAWDRVRTEFLTTMKRLLACDYENIVLISHEDSSKDITKKGGDKITAIKPNLAEKVSLKLAGMVDVVARIVADDKERLFCFKSNEVIFGGGRLKVDAKDIPLKVDALFAVYDEANKAVKHVADSAYKADSGVKNESAVNSSCEKEEALKSEIHEEPQPEVKKEEPQPVPAEPEPKEERKPRRTRKVRNAEPQPKPISEFGQNVPDDGEIPF